MLYSGEDSVLEDSGKDSDLEDLDLDALDLKTDNKEEGEQTEEADKRDLNMPEVSFDLVRNIPDPRFQDVSKTILAVQIKLDGATDCSTLEVSFDASKHQFTLTWKENKNMMVAESQLQHIIQDRGSIFSISYQSVMQERLDKKYSDEKSLHKEFKFSPPSGVKLDPNFIKRFTFGQVLDPFELTSTANQNRLHLDANYATFFMFVHTGLNTPNAAQYQRVRTFNGNSYSRTQQPQQPSPSFSCPSKQPHFGTNSSPARGTFQTPNDFFHKACV